MKTDSDTKNYNINIGKIITSTKLNIFTNKTLLVFMILAVLIFCFEVEPNGKRKIISNEKSLNFKNKFKTFNDFQNNFDTQLSLFFDHLIKTDINKNSLKSINDKFNTNFLLLELKSLKKLDRDEISYILNKSDNFLSLFKKTSRTVFDKKNLINRYCEYLFISEKLENNFKILLNNFFILEDLPIRNLVDKLKKSKRFYYTKKALGVLFLILLFTIIISIFIHIYNPNILYVKNILKLFGFLGFSLLFLSKIIAIIIKFRPVLSQFFSNNIVLFSPYMVPFSIAAIILSIVIDFKIAILFNIFISIICGLIFENHSLAIIIFAILNGTISIFISNTIHKRKDFINNGILIGILNIFIISIFFALEISVFTKSFFIRDIFWGFLNGITSSILVMILLPYIESSFNITTSLKLTELADTNNPLLQLLKEKAQGTFHHSLTVAVLAETASKSIGANALLAKVGAYYHDIGKIKKSEYFVENQTGENQHDNLTPTLSSLIIISHVKNGVELGKKYNLPDIIIDFIKQHHGTDLLRYFYYKAIEQETDAEIDENLFKYPGPKPQTNESAIVMLADCVEAATRSIKKPNFTNISNLVKKITNEKFIEGQFDECELTLKSLEKIADSFIKTLFAINHWRIEYPSKKEAISLEATENESIENDKIKEE